MLLQIVAVRDSAADAFMNPFFAHNTGSAVRSFKDEVTRKDDTNVLHKHPSDFELYLLGTFDPGNGSFEILREKALLIRGKDCVDL